MHSVIVATFYSGACCLFEIAASVRVTLASRVLASALQLPRIALNVALGKLPEFGRACQARVRVCATAPCLARLNRNRAAAAAAEVEGEVGVKLAFAPHYECQMLEVKWGRLLLWYGGFEAVLLEMLLCVS